MPTHVGLTSLLCALLAADELTVGVGLRSAAITGLGMIGLFFIPAVSSRQLPDVIRQRSRRAAAPGETDSQ
ncbi:hypothetical protein ADK43_34935 [Streptomyces rimosus subsp. rimosus]|nr:hypothetical protein ADK43_34935 [Streptomyces rimosus subsp. rimosus]